MDDSAIMCDEVIESYDEDTEAKSYGDAKTIPTNFNGKKVTCKTQNFHILLAFLLITIALFDKIYKKTKTFITISLHK